MRTVAVVVNPLLRFFAATFLVLGKKFNEQLIYMEWEQSLRSAAIFMNANRYTNDTIWRETKDCYRDLYVLYSDRYADAIFDSGRRTILA